MNSIEIAKRMLYGFSGVERGFRSSEEGLPSNEELVLKNLLKDEKEVDLIKGEENLRMEEL